MKMKKIITSALLVVMMFTAIASSLVISSSAAYSKYSMISAEQSNSSVAYVKETLKTVSYMTGEKMLLAEQEAGYISSYEVTAKDGSRYALYVNPFTGYIYYQNKVTGQILTSNPYNMTDVANDKETAMSQITLTYAGTDGLDITGNSYQLAAYRSQITLTRIQDGFRLNYTLGETASRFLLPGAMTYEDFMSDIFHPIYDLLLDKLEEYAGLTREETDFFTADAYNKDQKKEEDKSMLDGCMNFKAFKMKYMTSGGKLKQEWIKKKITDATQKKEVEAICTALTDIINQYTLQNPASVNSNETLKSMCEDMYSNYPITMGKSKDDISDDIAIVTLDATTATTPASMRKFSGYIRKYCPDYTFADLTEDENECGYVRPSTNKPIFRLALEYRLDPDDGTLLVSLPASSITFDRTNYTLKSLNVLPFFGAGNMSDANGYVFYPDGSGTVIQFGDFYTATDKENMKLTASVYGQDYCLSNIEGRAHEQVTMPVYGIVNKVEATNTTKENYPYDADTETPGVFSVTNGFLAILESGDSLAKLNVDANGSSSPYIGAFASYTPYAVDGFNLTETLGSVSGISGAELYYISSETPYGGNYEQRFVMLTDSTVAKREETIIGTDKANYVSTYVGMANYYRDYLRANEYLTALTEADVEDQIPLYIETIGTMDIDDTFLTFPITRTVALTSFEDVKAMYDDLANDGVKNVNFRLSNYANGGIYSTYPVKLKWERAAGGKRGFKNLLAYAAEVNAQDGQNLGIYPEFDFMYINYTRLFDGISNHNNVSRYLDNRYATRRSRSASSGNYSDSNSMVIAAEVLDKMTNKFLRKFGKYEQATGLSVSTMGSDLNSNFDEDATVDRETEKKNVTAVLDKLSSSYSLMIDKGNMYALKYADHILNANIDSSHFRKSSYAVPFVGMVLHGSINYTGSALNNSGSPEYDLLRSIESGASIYYILCYENLAHMKEKNATSRYYSVDYEQWYETMVETYNTLDEALGDLQTATIVNHRVVIGERVVSETERETFYQALTEEFLTKVEAAIAKAVNNKMGILFTSGIERNMDVTVDVDSLLALYKDNLLLNTESETYATSHIRYQLDADFEEELLADVTTRLNALKAQYETEYNNDTLDEENPDDASLFVKVDRMSVKYNASVSYLTTSSCVDSPYKTTEFTCDNGNIVIVTYKSGDTVKEFILNYNIFAVTVSYQGQIYTLPKYGFATVANTNN